MSHRCFKDAQGATWEAWTVTPAKVERRGLGASPIVLTEERRKESEYRVALGPTLSNGWLCFESEIEKRRLAPYPEFWENMTEEELVALLDTATPVPVIPRRLIE